MIAPTGYLARLPLLEEAPASAAVHTAALHKTI